MQNTDPGLAFIDICIRWKRWEDEEAEQSLTVWQKPVFQIPPEVAPLGQGTGVRFQV